MAANPIATFTTSVGTFTAEIYLDRVPRTASNFIDLAQTGFYDQLTFHRVLHHAYTRTTRTIHTTPTHHTPRHTISPHATPFRSSMAS